MKYLLILLTLLACAGAYYEHTLLANRDAGNQQQISDLQSKVDTLQSDGKKLEDEKEELDKSVADDQAKIADLTAQLGAAQKAAADAKKQADDATKALQAELAREKAAPAPAAKPTNYLGTIVTQNGKTFQNCTMLKADADGITVNSTAGISKLIYGILPPELQKKFGYDPHAAAKLSEAQVQYLEQQIEAAEAAGN